MKNLKIVGISALVVLGLVGCSEEVAEKEVKQVETTDQTEKTTETKKAPVKESKAPEALDIQIVDNESVKATLKTIEFVEDPAYDEEKYEITYEVENKTDKVILVQSRNVSADGMMVDEAMIMMSNEIAPGKKAKCVLEIMDWEGGPVPAMNENFEMILYVADNDSYEDIGEYKVNVDLK